MTITFNKNFTRTELREMCHLKLDNRKLLKECLVLAGEIKRRTAQGLGIEGGKLPDLSPLYAEWKRLAGRNPVPDRQLSGTLLNAIKAQVEGGDDYLVGTINFTERAHPGFQSTTYKKTGGRTSVRAVAKAMQKIKPFFGLSRKQRKQLMQNIAKWSRK